MPEISTKINTEIYKFLWNSTREQIKRDVLCNPKEEGGIGLIVINIFTKAKSIFLTTVLKMSMSPENDTIIKYYLSGKIDKYFKMDNRPRVTSPTNTTY